MLKKVRSNSHKIKDWRLVSVSSLLLGNTIPANKLFSSMRETPLAKESPYS
ncbi:hypothetical protein HMPREF1869_01149 [Bacteroidales bacterium KA00251]|nr:hypothetical protein HMPREF1869_01149 [Bacteroidales bacterium KA00251]